jgi:hypothetical protein
VTRVISDEALARLQRSLLEAILLDRPLPGAGRALPFGDRAFFLGRPTIAVLDENLVPGLSLDKSLRPLRRLSRDDLVAEARREGDLPYFRFSAPERSGDTVRLTIEADIAPADPDRKVLGLTSVQAAFRETNGDWKVEGEPVSLAN